ncbi:MAG: hypothetical protein E2P02_06405 [Acidobacteria bacterium]|nr:MAG: hypothetical protein E2P02_06405 [Acidobacteriota bacterium]
MTKPFDSDAIAKLGWRQGAILGSKLAELACKHAPDTVAVDRADWLIVTSHDCDIVNFSIDKEPVVEVLRASVGAGKKVDKQQSWGRNPRTLQLAVDLNEDPVVLSCTVHDRWTIPRGLLLQEAPAGCLRDKERRLIAKRYIRAAFPTAFDLRWRTKLKDWQKLLKKNSEWLQDVYLRMSTLDELPEGTPYKCHLILAIPHAKRGGTVWAQMRNQLGREFQAFWDQFKPPASNVPAWRCRHPQGETLVHTWRWPRPREPAVERGARLASEAGHPS